MRACILILRSGEAENDLLIGRTSKDCDYMNRLRHMDSMRALAAFAVIYFHIGVSTLRVDLVSNTWERAIFEFFTQTVDLGKIAVIIFFLISGFVIPFSLLRKRPFPIRDFVISRIFRLYPAYWLSIPLGIWFFFGPQTGYPSSATIALNVAMMQQFFGAENIIGLYWTLQIELIFYFVTVLMFTLGWLAHPRYIVRAIYSFLALAVFSAVLRYFGIKALSVAVPLSLCVMYLGYLTRLASVKTGDNLDKEVRYALSWILGVIPLVCYFGYHEFWPRYIYTYYIAVGLFFLLTFRWKLNGSIWPYLGKISFSLYLFGPIAQAIVTQTIGKNMSGIPIHLFVLIVIVLTILIASIVYKAVEAPSISLGRSLSNRLNSSFKTDDAQI